VVSRRLPDAAAQIPFQIRACGILWCALLSQSTAIDFFFYVSTFELSLLTAGIGLHLYTPSTRTILSVVQRETLKLLEAALTDLPLAETYDPLTPLLLRSP
jgi:hypothetical protein